MLTGYVEIFSSTTDMGKNKNTLCKNCKVVFAIQKTLIKHPPKHKIPKLEGIASYYVNELYISTYLDDWCHR